MGAQLEGIYRCRVCPGSDGYRSGRRWLARAGWFRTLPKVIVSGGRHYVGGDAGRRTASCRAFGGVTGSGADLFVALDAFNGPKHGGVSRDYRHRR